VLASAHPDYLFRRVDDIVPALLGRCLRQGQG
jgi:hypothetical protein